MTTETSLAGRLDFIGLDAPALATLAALRPQITAALPSSLDTFYGKLRRTPEVARFFSSESHLSTAKSAQQRHWETIATAAFDQSYTASVQRIGGVHARIGLEPRWYVGGYAEVLCGLVSSIVHDSRRSPWRRKGGDKT
ncbi:MAG TPA: protoglobin domain-containing protein, partial [Phenylobacterium sp.]